MNGRVLKAVCESEVGGDMLLKKLVAVVSAVVVIAVPYVKVLADDTGYNT